MNTTVRVRYFALLRDQRGLGEEQVQTETSTAGELYEELRKKHGFTLEAARLRVAINDGFVPWDSALRSGEMVVFIPPVAGG